VVSRKTVARLSRYRRLLAALRERGVARIYSHELARHAAVSAAQVRRDLMAIGYSGSPNRGYDVAACIDSITALLDGGARQEVALVGVGNLGRAILAHFADKSPTVAIAVAFDRDPALVGQVVHGVRCLDVAAMEQVVADLGVQIAVLAVPGESAQEVADALVRAGVKSIISFAPTPLQLPDGIFVEYMDITAALESAAYFARLGAPREDDRATAAEVTAMTRRLQPLLARSGMRLGELAQRIGARVVTDGGRAQAEVTRVYAGDRVSDLLNEADEHTLLVSNLASAQLLRVAELMDVPGICFVNGHEPDAGMVQLAERNGTLLMVADEGVFETCGRIYQAVAGEGEEAREARA
jgi:redox-sensing transcriptional repressor